VVQSESDSDLSTMGGRYAISGSSILHFQRSRIRHHAEAGTN
tara:strand:- start:307 stop:432 length:126 start_codon:yes stop_codon:yes gene_type:complete